MHLWLSADFYSLKLDCRIKYKMLYLSVGRKDVISHEEMQDPSQYETILSEEALAKQCYWEVEVNGGRVDIGVSSKTNVSDNQWQMSDDQTGQSQAFPCLVIYQNKLHGFLQNGQIFANCPDFDSTLRIGVYLHKEAEYLSFYRVCEEKLTLLGKFSSSEFCKVTSARRLFAAFRLYSNSKVKICTPWMPIRENFVCLWCGYWGYGIFTVQWFHFFISSI